MNRFSAPKSRLPITMSGFFDIVSERRPRKNGKTARARP
jgi:hypothetical protein